MKSILKTFGFAMFLLFLVACATLAVKTVANTEPAPTKDFVLANFSEDQLGQGKTLFEANCVKCHNLKDPESKNPEQWNKTLIRMLPRTNLAYEEGRLVQAYLVANSK
jgi:cytochrome c2